MNLQHALVCSQTTWFIRKGDAYSSIKLYNFNHIPCIIQSHPNGITDILKKLNQLHYTIILIALPFSTTKIHAYINDLNSLTFFFKEMKKSNQILR